MAYDEPVGEDERWGELYEARVSMESRLARIEEKLDGLSSRMGRLEYQLWALVGILLAGFITVIATLLAAD